MRTDDLAFRPATAADLPGILALLSTSLGTGRIPRDEGFWRWKHEQTPFGSSPTWLALSGEQVVGLRVFLRWEWRARGQTVRAVRAVDTATHLDFQGRGIFKRLTSSLVEQMRDEGIGFVFNTPNDKSRPGYLKMGWSDVGRVPLWAKPVRPLRGTARRVFKRPFSVEPRRQEREELEELLGHSDLDSLTSDGRGDRYETPRSPEFLRWRYLDVPGFSYGARVATRRGSTAAVIYRRRSRGGLCEGTILDVMAAPGRRGAALSARLLRSLGSELGVDYLVASAAVMSRDGVMLAGGGFVPLGRRGPWLTARALHAAPLEPTRHRSWSWRAGDLELF